MIVAVMAFPGCPNDSTTMEPLLEQMRRNGLELPERMAYDRGGRDRKKSMT